MKFKLTEMRLKTDNSDTSPRGILQSDECGNKWILAMFYTGFYK